MGGALAAACGVLVAALGGVVMAGWILEIQLLVQPLPHAPAIQFITAFCFVLAGLALAGARLGALPGLVPALGLLVAAAGLATLAEFGLDVEVGIDQLLRDPGFQDYASHPGRMAPDTAVAMFLAGIGLTAGSLVRPDRRAAWMALTGSIAFALGVVAALGYLTGVRTSGWGGATAMAPPTSGLLMLFAWGLLMHSWALAHEEGREFLGWLPFGVMLLGVAGTLYLWQGTLQEGRLDRRASFEAAAADMSSDLSRLSDDRLKLLRRVSRRLAIDAVGPAVAWSEESASLLADFPDLAAVGWVPLEGEPQWRSRTRWSPEHLDILEPAVAHPPGSGPETRTLALGETCFLLGAVPVRRGGRLEGQLVGVFDSSLLAREAVGSPPPPYRIRIHQEDLQVFGDAQPLPSAVRGRAGLWTAEVGPAGREAYETIARLVLAFGLATTLLLGSLVAAGQRLERQSRGLRLANAGLSSEIQGRVGLQEELEALNRGLDEQVRLRTAEAEEGRRQAEEAGRLLAERVQDLARSNRDLEQFAYAASHDLQEPLRAMAGYAALIERRGGDLLEPREREHLGRIRDSAARMQQLIEDLLAWSRVTTRAQPLRPVSTGAVVARALENLRVAVDESGAILEVGELPEVEGDPGQLTQLFQNLLSNALKFRRGEPVRVQVRALRRSEGWEIQVEDNGLGIEPAYQERIFQLFQRLHTRDRYPGTGIGLALCRKVAERHGGRLWVTSTPGEGSTFHVLLPEAGSR